MHDATGERDGERRGGDRASSSGSLSRRRVLATAATTVLGCASRSARTVAESIGAGRLRDEVWVETDVDTDGDGTNDRVYVSVTRPASTTEGRRVPVIATATPYNGEQDHGDTTDEMLYDRRTELAASDGDDRNDGDDARREAPAANRAGGTHGPQTDLSHPRRLERRYLPQDYAVANVSSLGTHESTGCYTAAGPETAQALRAVVDWFNGRATAYDAKRGGDPVTADWSTGKTGMIGTSANGELANAVATTGVDGLEAIVPVAANDGQYSLFRSNGTPISVVPKTGTRIGDLSSWVAASNRRRPNCQAWAERVADRQDHATGDYNDFWHEREFLPQADDVEAAVLLTHAVDDPIVKPNNFADWYEALDSADVPLRLWLHEGGHATPESQAWRDLVDRWWEHWLKGVDNGVMDEDPVSVVHGGSSATSGTLDTYTSWPVPDATPTTVGFAGDGTSVGEVVVGGPESDPEPQSFVDDPSQTVATLAAADESTHRLRYQTPRLGTPVQISGRVVPNLRVSFDDPTVVSVALVEYGTTTEVVTRGWADPLNRPRYGDYDTPVAYKQSLRESTPVDADERVRVEFPLQATDHVFDVGSRIGVVVYASDSEFTLHPPGESTVTLSPSDSELELPVVGGRSALTDAFVRTDGDDTASETPDEGGSTPGFGLATAAAGLGGAGYRFARRRAGADSDSRE